VVPQLSPDGAAIICRNNAPLYKTAMDLIRAGRGVQLVGADIGPASSRSSAASAPNQPQRSSAMDSSTSGRPNASERQKVKPASLIAQNAYECSAPLAEILEKLSLMQSISSSNRVQCNSSLDISLRGSNGTLFTISIRGESPPVYAETPEELEQELNVRYVIETRAKRELYLVNERTFNMSQPNSHLRSILLERINMSSCILDFKRLSTRSIDSRS
jgi:hypothetical protein